MKMPSLSEDDTEESVDKKEFDLTVFIGRFQPFHKGHLQVIRSALKRSKRILILIGSANISRDTRNPFNYLERYSMINSALYKEYKASIPEEDGTPVWSIDSLDDFHYNDQGWISQVQTTVAEFVEDHNLGHDYLTNTSVEPRIAITGHERDATSWYIRKFPQWTYLKPETEVLHINATELRYAYFGYGAGCDPDVTSVWDNCPPETINFLQNFQTTRYFSDLEADFLSEREAENTYGSGPFLTTDAILVQSGHVLVVERGKSPGKGKFALPGGYLEVDETLDAGCMRELFEETKLFNSDFNNAWGLSTPEAHFYGMKERVWPHFRAREIFDAPQRSTRGRVITTAFLFKLPDAPVFPDVLASDDAARAFWMPLSEIKTADFFDDHAAIIAKMLTKL